MLNKDSGNDAFERLLTRTIAHEISPSYEQCSYGMETFLLSLSGELLQEQEERMRAHLLICPRCTGRYDSLATRVHQEEEELSESVHDSSLVAHLKRKAAQPGGARQRAFAWFTAKPGSARIAIGGGVAFLLICLIVVSSLTIHRMPAHGAHKSNGNMVAKGGPLAVANVPSTSVLTPKSLIEKLDAIGGYDTWRAAAFIIGYLRAAGVPLESVSIAFEHQTIYVTGDDDTWETVSQKVLGDKDLWPIIILLNRDRTVNGEFPPVGTVLRVPVPTE